MPMWFFGTPPGQPHHGMPIVNRKVERPPAVCPECEGVAIEWHFKGEGYYLCPEPTCAWDGKLDSSCDCCDRPMQTTGPIVAYGIETYACSVCRKLEY